VRHAACARSPLRRRSARRARTPYSPSRAGRFDVKRIYHSAHVSAIKALSCGSRPSTPRSAARHCRRRRELAPPARAHRRPSTPRPSLDITRASRATHCAAPPRASPESVRPQARRLGPVAVARRSSPQPCHRHRSARGEPNRTPVPHVALFRPHLAAGVPPHRRKGLVVKSRGLYVN
jgi:hypothetical protein